MKNIFSYFTSKFRIKYTKTGLEEYYIPQIRLYFMWHNLYFNKAEDSVSYMGLDHSITTEYKFKFRFQAVEVLGKYMHELKRIKEMEDKTEYEYYPNI